MSKKTGGALPQESVQVEAIPAGESPRRRWGGLLSSVCASILLVLFASPYITLWRIQSAVNAGNAATLNRFVAWEAVRTDVKTEVRALIQTFAQREATSSDDWLAATLLGPEISDALVDTLVTADNITRLVEGRAMDFSELGFGFLGDMFASGLQTGLQTVESADGFQADWNSIREKMDYSYGYVSFDVFELRVTLKPRKESEPGLPVGRLLLTRSGLGWDVSGVRFATDVVALVEAVEAHTDKARAGASGSERTSPPPSPQEVQQPSTPDSAALVDPDTLIDVATTTDSAAPSQPATPLDQAALGAVPVCSFLDPTFYCEGFGVEVGSATEYLDAGATSTYTLDLQIGDHILTGRCDSDCNDIDLEVHDANGTLVVEDVDSDDAPTVRLSVTTPGQYRLTVSMYACSVEPCEFTVGILKKATTTAEDVATTTAALILATAQVVATPTSVDYASRLMDWTRLENLFPSRSWSDRQDDPDHWYVRRAEVAEGVTVEAKGARTIIVQTIISYAFFNPDFSNPSAEGRRLDLLSEFESALTPTIVRCQSDNPWLGERWYRVSIEGMEPLTAKYDGSSGSGGGSESLTFDHSEPPPVGTEALRGTWMDVCQD